MLNSNLHVMSHSGGKKKPLKAPKKADKQLDDVSCNGLCFK